MQLEIPFIGQVERTEQDEWIEAINSRASKFHLQPLDSMQLDVACQAEVAVVANPDPTRLNELPNIKWIQSLWAGVEGIIGANINPDVSIVRMTDPQMAESMAEAVLAWTLYLHRKMPQYQSQQSQKKWQPLSLDTPQDCNVSVFGLGKLGSKAALRLKQNQFTVRGWSSSKKSLNGVETFHGATGLDSILAITDIAVLLLPLTSATEGLFNKEKILKLPKSAAMINFARGPILPEPDLIECLNSKHLDHAVLDVFNEEPLAATNPLWAHPDVTVLPHISAPTTISTAAEITANNIDHYLKTGNIPEAADRSRGY